MCAYLLIDFVQANYASSSVRYDFGQTARPLICAKLQLASGDNVRGFPIVSFARLIIFKSRLVSGLLKDRVFHHDQLDLKTATSTGHPFRSDLIPEILQLILFDEKSKTDGLILQQLNELERVPIRFIAFIVTLVCPFFCVPCVI